MPLPPLEHSTGARAWKRDLAGHARNVTARDERIRRSYHQGYHVDRIAAAYGLSRRRIYEILNLNPGDN